VLLLAPNGRLALGFEAGVTGACCAPDENAANEPATNAVNENKRRI
jgi:hypothetical protein